MAVTKIRKTSSTVLLVVMIFAIAVMGFFAFGGYEDPTAATLVPKYTDLLLYTVYGVLLLTLVVALVFAIVGFVKNLKTNAKGAIAGLVALVALVVLLIVFYSVGSTASLADTLGSDALKYNTDYYLKLSDMWLYGIYTMLGLCIGALIWGGIRGAIIQRRG